MKNARVKISTILVALVVLVGSTSALSAHALFGEDDITLVDIVHDITVEIPAIIEQVVLTAVNDSANAALKATLTSGPNSRKITDPVNYAINLTNDVYVDRAMVNSNDSNTALTKTLIAQQQGLSTASGSVNTGQIAQQRALTAFNPYSINAQVGNANVSLVDVLAPASNPSANPVYQQQAMSGNASSVLALAQQGSNKDIAAGSGYKSTYSGTTGNLSVSSASKDVDSALDSIVSSSFGNQQKPQNNISAMFLALSDAFIKSLSNELTGVSSSALPNITVSSTPAPHTTSY